MEPYDREEVAGVTARKPRTQTTQEQITVVHVCTQEGRLKSLEEWQERQNGSLNRIEAKVDRLMWTTLSGMGLIILALVGLILDIFIVH